jgi:uncharacterized protein
MATFFITALVIALVMTAMAVGVLIADKPIKGSCGGMGALGIDTACDICGGDPKLCDEETRDSEASLANPALFYSADK